LRVDLILTRGTPAVTAAQAARSLGLQPQGLYIEKAEDLGPAFDAAVKQRADVVLRRPGGAPADRPGGLVELDASLIAMRTVLDATAVCALTVFRWLVP